MQVLIVMISWSPNIGRLVLCQQTIESLLQNTVVPYELALVDNGPASQTEMLRQYPIDYHLVQEKNVGISAARNIGAQANSNLPYICFLDSDLRFTKGWLAGALAYLKTHVDLPIIVASLERTDMKRRSRAMGILDGWSIWTRACGGCLTMPRKIYDRIGPWPETNRMGYDMSTLAFHNGYRFVLAEPPTVFHTDYHGHHSERIMRERAKKNAVASSTM